MGFRLTTETASEFIEFLKQTIIKLQNRYNEGNYEWESNLCDLTPPCRIELFTSDVNSIALILPDLKFQNSPIEINHNILTNNRNDNIQILQEWVDNENWSKFPNVSNKTNYFDLGYKRLLRKPDELTFPEVLAVKTGFIEKFCTTDFGENDERISGMLHDGLSFWLSLNCTLELNYEKWEKYFIIPKRIQSQIELKQEPDQEQVTIQNNKFDFNEEVDYDSSIPSESDLENKKIYGFSLYPPIWIDDFYFLDVRNFVKDKEFRLKSKEIGSEIIGSFIFSNYTIKITRFGLIFVDYKIKKIEALNILNNLIFTIRFLSTTRFKEYVNKMIPISGNDLVEAEHSQPSNNKTRLKPITWVPVLRNRWINLVLMKMDTPLDLQSYEREFYHSDKLPRDFQLYLYRTREVLSTFESANQIFQDFEIKFDHSDEISELMIYCYGLIKDGNAHSAFIIGCLALERIISDIWKRSISSNSKRDRKSWKNKNMELKSANYLSNFEFKLIDHIREVRNNHVHSGKNQFKPGFGENLTKASSIIDICLLLIERTLEKENSNWDIQKMDLLAKLWEIDKMDR